jgi:hypothetical protein
MDGPAATHVDIAIARNGKLNSSAPVQQKCAATDKRRSGDLRKVFRLEMGPTPCFLSLTREFNCTLVSVSENEKRMKIEAERRPELPTNLCPGGTSPDRRRSPSHQMC